MARKTETPAVAEKKPLSAVTLALLIVPLILLGGVIALFLATGGGLSLESPVPIESLVVERVRLEPGVIHLTVRNASLQEVEIAQVGVNEGIWPFSVYPSRTIPRLGQATVSIPYDWVEGEAYGVTLFTSNAIAFGYDIPAAVETAEPTGRTFLGFTLIGLYVGVIPVALGLLWFPAMRQLGRRWIVFLMALTAGLLIFLGVDALSEALEQAANVPGSFQGNGLIAIGGITTFLLLDAISRWQTKIGRSDADRRLSLAYMIAVGIGLHNLGEGLAIGAAYNLGEIALGTFLVVGFIIQNITEGLGIIAPILRDRPGILPLALMGLVGGGPAIVGAWIGGFAPDPTLAVLFLAIGAGAVFEVVWEIGKLIRKDTEKEAMPLAVASGVVSGMLLLWGTGLLIK